MKLDFDKLDKAVTSACKEKIYVRTPMGSVASYDSFTLAISGNDYLPVEKRRLSIGHVPAAIHRSEKNYSGRTESWHDPIPTARADAELLAMLWNDAEELIRLAKLGEKFEAVQAAH